MGRVRFITSVQFIKRETKTFRGHREEGWGGGDSPGGDNIRKQGKMSGKVGCCESVIKKITIP